MEQNKKLALEEATRVVGLIEQGDLSDADKKAIHGTTETCILTMLKITNESVSGKKILVSGYGPVGFGTAKRLRALGGEVYVSEISNLQKLKAKFDGFPVYDAEIIAGEVDIIMSCSGYEGAISKEIIDRLKDGCIIASLGGTYGEIDFASFEKELSEDGTYTLDISGRKVRVLAKGLGINYVANEGNPIEIMDMSFAGQIKGIEYLFKNSGKLANKVHFLEKGISEEIAGM